MTERDPYLVQLGSLLREARRSYPTATGATLTLEPLAERVGSTKGWLSRVENGYQLPSRELLDSLFQVLPALDVDEVLDLFRKAAQELGVDPDVPRRTSRIQREHGERQRMLILRALVTLYLREGTAVPVDALAAEVAELGAFRIAGGAMPAPHRYTTVRRHLASLVRIGLAREFQYAAGTRLFAITLAGADVAQGPPHDPWTPSLTALHPVVEGMAAFVAAWRAETALHAQIATEQTHQAVAEAEVIAREAWATAGLTPPPHVTFPSPLPASSALAPPAPAAVPPRPLRPPLPPPPIPVPARLALPVPFPARTTTGNNEDTGIGVRETTPLDDTWEDGPDPETDPEGYAAWADSLVEVPPLPPEDDE